MTVPSTSTEWYLARDGQRYGPISVAEMAKLVELDHLKPTDLLWRTGWPEWTSVTRLSQSSAVELPPPLPAPISDPTLMASDEPAIGGGVTDEALLGAHLVVPKSIGGVIKYTHHGIYIGNGEVIHYAGFSEDPEADGKKIQTTTLKRFIADGDLTIRPHPDARLHGADVVARARERLGEDGYSLFGNNCEHFCNWAIDGDHQSNQVDAGMRYAAPGAGVAAGGLGAGGVIGAGAAAGLAGGAGMMNSLAAAGAIVGGGAVSGIAAIGGGAGIATAWLMNRYVLAESEGHSQEEKDAREAGRNAGVAGVGLGTVGAVAAVGVAAAEGVAGAAAITSGLAGVGAVLGGGMATGVALTVAAPAAAAVAAGYGIYKLAQRHEGARTAINSASKAIVGTAEAGAEMVGNAISAATPPSVQNGISSATDVAKTKAEEAAARVREVGETARARLATLLKGPDDKTKDES